MVAISWRVWTAFDCAAQYEADVKNRLFPSLAAKRRAGFLGSELWCRRHTDDVEFTTMLWFLSSHMAWRALTSDPAVLGIQDALRGMVLRAEQPHEHRVVQPGQFSYRDALQGHLL